MTTIDDPIRSGLARSWKVTGADPSRLEPNVTCDVAIVGSGAGGGVAADILSAAGLDVVIVEEGTLRGRSDFRAQQEREAYPALYQDSASRKTADKAIAILQGRRVAGSTTVKWTSSFRTPGPTLAYWQKHFGLQDLTEATLAPWFKQAEKRLGVAPWLAAPNTNKQLLRDGAARLGIPAAAIAPNVRGCWNLGSCGLGCPTNAKQSMVGTTIPAALDRGAPLVVQTRVERLTATNSSRPTRSTDRWASSSRHRRFTP